MEKERRFNTKALRTHKNPKKIMGNKIYYTTHIVPLSVLSVLVVKK